MFHKYHYVYAVYKEGSFTKAAEEFFTSQPTISRQIAALEEELGFELFYRDGRQLRLTSGGLVMLAEFSQQEKNLRDAISRVEQIQSGMEGSLSIGFLTSFDTDIYVYPPSMAFSEQFPNITITMDSGSFAPLRQRLYDGEYDIIFTYSFDLPFMKDVLSQPVYRTGCSLVSSANHPIAGKDTLTAADLRGQTLILPFSPHLEGWETSISQMMARGFGMTAEDYAKFDVRVVDTLETKQFLVRSGAANAVAPTANQGLSDMTVGGEILNGKKVPINHLVLVPRGDGRGIIITSSESYVMVRGPYSVE